MPLLFPWIARPRQPLALIAPVPAEIMGSEIGRLGSGQFLLEQGPFQVILARQAQIPALMLEVGRLRELTFRSIGEGTSASFDLDEFDRHYDQLILWNRERREVAGGYRLALVDRTLRQYGPAGLYTASLFRMDGPFFERLGPAIELGRSFVRPEYQRRSHALLLLWRGIGRYLDLHPGYRRLFGPVSISAGYSSAACSVMAGYLDRCEGDEPLRQHVRPRRRFRASGNSLGAGRVLNVDELDCLVRATGLETDRRGIPVLLRHYLGLGGRVLAISVDPSFGNCLDALVVVDLLLSDAKLLDRALGRYSRAGSGSPEGHAAIGAVQV